MKLTKEMAEKIFSAKDYEEAKKQAAEVGYEMSEQEDAELKKTFTHELSDDELDAVAGGYTYYLTNDNTTQYEWKGSDENLKYLCPNCGRPVHKGTFGMFYCDPCDESWFWEKELEPNLKNWELSDSVTCL